MKDTEWRRIHRKRHPHRDHRSQADLPLAVLAQAVPNGEALDAFDLIAHVAFDQPPLSRRERAEQVRKRNDFGKSGAATLQGVRLTKTSATQAKAP